MYKYICPQEVTSQLKWVVDKHRWEGDSCVDDFVVNLFSKGVFVIVPGKQIYCLYILINVLFWGIELLLCVYNVQSSYSKKSNLSKLFGIRIFKFRYIQVC